MSRIVTFYSFKGGVGRSMALANVAVLLARRGLRVLAVDWDLEAPGLERYFDSFDLKVKRGGLLPFLVEQSARLAASEGADPARYSDHLWKIDVGGAHPLALLGSGRFEHSDYARVLERFEWPEFFLRGGGDLLEQLRERWRADFDVVLVDSRTGMSDAGGICTIQMPDVLVTMFTANYQSLFGVRDIIQSVQASRQHLAYDRMALNVLPVPCRFKVYIDAERSAEWLGRIADELGPLVRDWLPRSVALQRVLERISVPQVDRFAFGELLAIIDEDPDASPLVRAYDRIARLLATDLRGIETTLDLDIPKLPAGSTDNPLPIAPVAGYQYDVFVSYRHTGGAIDEWVQSFMRALTPRLSQQIGRPCTLFKAPSEQAGGATMKPASQNNLLRSRCLLAVLTPQYFASSSCLSEWQDFESRESATGKSLITSIALGNVSSFPGRIRSRELTRVDLAAVRKHKTIPQALVDEVVQVLYFRVRNSPPYSPDPRFGLPFIPPIDDGTELPKRHGILLLAANPGSENVLSLEAEAREIENELQRSAFRNHFDLRSRWVQDTGMFAGMLAEFEPMILHFSGHGSNDGLFFVGNDGLPARVHGGAIGKLIHDSPSVRMVVLSACYSEVQAREISDFVDFVVGMPTSAEDIAARTFSAAFYEVLAAGHSVAIAFHFAEKTLAVHYPDVRPVLYARSSIDESLIH